MIADLEFCSQLGAVARKVAETMDSISAQHGVPVGPATVLVAVQANPGQTQVAYATALSINDATLTRYIDRLEDAELIERKRGREDRRVVRLFPTSAGINTATAIKNGFADLQASYENDLGAAEFGALASGLREFALSLANRS